MSQLAHKPPTTAEVTSNVKDVASSTLTQYKTLPYHSHSVSQANCSMESTLLTQSQVPFSPRTFDLVFIPLWAV